MMVHVKRRAQQLGMNCVGFTIASQPEISLGSLRPLHRKGHPGT